MNLGFFANFKGGDSVLLDGSPEEISHLANHIQEFVDSGIERSHINDFARVRESDNVKLYLSRDLIRNDSEFQWKCSDDDAKAIREKLMALASATSGHQYFDLFNSKAQLNVSVGEYGRAWWEKHS